MAREKHADDSAAEIDKSVVQLLKDLRDGKVKPGADLDAHVKVLTVAIKWNYVRSRSKQPKWGADLGADPGEDAAMEAELDKSE